MDYLVTVCAACLTASCWHGEFMCERSRGADVRDLPASELRKLGREHPDNFSREKVLAVTANYRRILRGVDAGLTPEQMAALDDARDPS